VVRANGLFEIHAPVREILRRMQPTDFLRTARELASDVAFVEAVVRGHDRLLAILASLERLRFCLHQLAQRHGQIRLPENFSGHRRGTLSLAIVNQERPLRLRPLAQLVLELLDRIRGLRFDRIAVGHLDCRREHFGEAQLPVLREHHHDPARRARRNSGEWPELRWIFVTLVLEELRRGARRRGAERIDADDLAGVRVIDERLRLAAPAERVPHRGSCGDHCARGVDCIAAFDEGGGAGGRSERFAGDSDPVLAVQRWFDSFRRGGGACQCESGSHQGHVRECFHAPTLPRSNGHLSYDGAAQSGGSPTYRSITRSRIENSGDAMSEVILHHYPLSPYAEKARTALGIKRLAWRSVIIPVIMPKPDLMPLTGGYRKTPVMQIGADIYCDTQLILRELERRFPEPSLYRGTDAGTANALSFYLDRTLFSWVVGLAFGLSPRTLPEGFAEDRAKFSGRELNLERLKQAVPMLVDML